MLMSNVRYTEFQRLSAPDRMRTTRHVHLTGKAKETAQLYWGDFVP
jgi:hypothetical protein